MKRRAPHTYEIACSRQLAGRLRELRAASGLTQEAVAHGAGIAANTYQKYEKGESKPGTPMNPQLYTLLSLSRVFKIELSSLLDFDTDYDALGGEEPDKGL